MENWINESTIINGDLSYSIKKGDINTRYVDIELICYSSKWSKFDCSFEFREEGEEWRTDASILYSTANSVYNNKLMNLECSSSGVLNLIRWEYSKNNLEYGKSIEIRLNILPRYLIVSSSGVSNIVSENSGIKCSEFIDSISNITPIKKNNDGYFIALSYNAIKIYSNLSSSPIKTYTGLSAPRFATQINNGNYLIANTGVNTIVELNETLTSLINFFSVGSPVYIDYKEESDTMLITSSSGTIYEYSRETYDLLWTSSYSFTQLSTATYSKVGSHRIIATDFSGKVVIFDRNKNSITEFDGFSDKNNNTDSFINPYIAIEFENYSIGIIEGKRRNIEFDSFESSSSSSQDSSSSSSMSSSSLSSSSG